MKKILPVSVLIVALAVIYAFKSRDLLHKYSVIVVQYQTENPKAVMQDIYKYTFENGEFKGKEKILSVTGRENNKDLNRFDSEGGFIFKNRWLVSGIGNIVDLQTKKVITSERATFIRTSGDSIIFYTNDAFKGKFYSVFDAKTGKYEQVKSVKFKAIIGQDIGLDYDTPNRRIWLYPMGKEKVLLVADAGFGEEVINSKSTSTIPVMWVDADDFIYPYYNISKNEATIFKVNVNKTITKIGVIKDIPKGHQNSYFAKDGDDNIEYICGKGKFYIDVAANKISEVAFEHEGNGFDVECKTQAYGHLIKFNKQDIGKYQCDMKNVRTCAYAIALDNKMKIGDEVYPQGIAIWNSESKKWKSIEAEEVAAVLGWVVEN
ncbi:MAG: hypothetical protein K0S33_3960 [Bacteroidetes bacterium]|jgi:hypothetical protein|nr:hypothetical protein [Bacteroidota bacterium]